MEKQRGTFSLYFRVVSIKGGGDAIKVSTKLSDACGKGTLTLRQRWNSLLARLG